MCSEQIQEKGGAPIEEPEVHEEEGGGRAVYRTICRQSG